MRLTGRGPSPRRGLTGLASSLARVPGATAAWAAGFAGNFPDSAGLILLDGRV